MFLAFIKRSCNEKVIIYSCRSKPLWRTFFHGAQKENFKTICKWKGTKTFSGSEIGVLVHCIPTYSKLFNIMNRLKCKCAKCWHPPSLFVFKITRDLTCEYIYIFYLQVRLSQLSSSTNLCIMYTLKYAGLKTTQFGLSGNPAMSKYWTEHILGYF